MKRTYINGYQVIEDGDLVIVKPVEDFCGSSIKKDCVNPLRRLARNLEDLKP